MQVKMRTGLAGPHLVRRPGDLHECDESEAARLLAAGYAEPLDDAGEELRQRVDGLTVDDLVANGIPQDKSARNRRKTKARETAVQPARETAVTA